METLSHHVYVSNSASAMEQHFLFPSVGTEAHNYNAMCEFFFTA